MQLTPPSGLVSHERALTISPRMRMDVGGWARHLRFWPGRSLSADALALESHNHVSHLARATTSFAPGIIDGLDISTREDRTRTGSVGDPASDWWVIVRPGLGLSVGGEDVSLPRPLHVHLDDIPVIGDPATIGGALPTRARGLGILLLQPVTVINENNRDDASLACSDVNDDAYSDRVVTDACRLVWHPWPRTWMRTPTRSRRFRNQLAYRLFAWEADNPDRVPPWHNFGVPLALVEVSGDGNVQFVDRHIVARSGGGSPASPLMAGQGHPALWQARITQFAQHLSDIAAAGTTAKDAETIFQFLPPFAVIPRGLVNLQSLQTDFLPANCRMQAVPIPQEQLEVLLDSVAGLAPLDLINGDACAIYIPVPQHRYDPRLLFRDVIDPSFTAAVQAIATQVGEFKARRTALRTQVFHIHSAITRAEMPSFPDPDPATVPGEPTTGSIPSGATPEHDYALDARTTVSELASTLKSRYDFLSAEVDARLPLSAWNAEPLTTPANDAQTFAGLQAWAENLEQRISRGNDAVNYGFLRAQTDIYRVRQLMLGNVEASRLAVSPALASIAQGDSSHAKQAQLGTFFKNITEKSQTTFKMMKMSSLPEGADGLDTIGEGSGGGGGSGDSNVLFPIMGINMLHKRNDTNLLMTGIIKDDALRLFGSQTITPKFELNKVLSGGVLGAAGANTVTTNDIIGKRALVGKIPSLRTTTMVDRLTDPPAPEAKNGAVASRLQIIADIVRMHPDINLDNVSIPVAQPEVAVFPKPWFDTKFTELSTAHNTLLGKSNRTSAEEKRFTVLQRLVPAIDQRAVLGRARTALWMGQFATQIRRDLASEVPDWHNKQTVQVQLTDDDLMEELGRGLFDPDPENGDEGGYYAAAVAAQELAIAALRAVEGRLDAYEKALTDIQEAITAIRTIDGKWSRRLQAIDTQFAEARHDLSVAHALRDEELERIRQINQRRSDTLRDHVSKLVITRLRSVAAVDDLPERHLDQVWTDPVPEALAEEFELPDELEQAVTTWRHAPIAWLPAIRKLAEQLDRRAALQVMVADARLRATARTSNPTKLQINTSSVGTAMAVQRLLTGWHEHTQRRWYNTAKINLGTFSKLGWQESARAAAEHLSLDDLCAASHGKTTLAQLAGKQLSHIAAIAGTLYRYAGKVPVATRLDWAEAISVFDRVVDLRDLDWLPGFSQLGRELRRDLQRLVSWLFAQVDSQRNDGLQLATDLVRVALLLACHAPVGALITGRVTTTTTVRHGDRFTVAVDAGMPRLGHKVGLFINNNRLANAVVEDLGERTAMVRLINMQSVSTTLTLTSDVRAVFG